ncbi:hypothetical protein BG015_006399 [Linnemannia schmuckeri]|uniref:Uncharacterized protein n=1 Tax=Linnemannia schmuckeri TaxID=64567 RepID=A0A9P5S3B6_9FUNG|nr:hypothetical protein BG015_006399 [Linnemannia schmuckeri]
MPSFAGRIYFSLWSAGKMHVFDRKGYSLKNVILMAPVLTAILVTISRIEGYRHSAVNVGWGAITRSHSHIPYPPRDFNYLVNDNDGKVHEAGRLEAMTGIHPNEEFIDETQQQPEQLADLETHESSPCDAWALNKSDWVAQDSQPQ